MIAGPRTVELHDLGAGLDDDATLDRATSSSTVPSQRGVERLEHEPVALEQRVLLAGVDPPALQDLVAHPVAVVDEPLDGVGDLELAARRRFDRAHRVVDLRVEEVHADDREVGRRVLRLLDELHDLAVGAEHRDARLAGVVDVREQDLRREHAAVGVGRRARSASNASTNSLRPCCSMLSPRYITKSSSPRKSRAMSTQWARPSGASWRM